MITLSHAYHPNMIGLVRVVNEVHTNCFYSFIKDQPEHPRSRCNDGKGFRTDFAKASEYEFDGDTIRVLNPRTKDGSILMEFQVYPPEYKQTILYHEGGDCHVQLKQTGINKFRKKGKSHELF